MLPECKLKIIILTFTIPSKLKYNYLILYSDTKPHGIADALASLPYNEQPHKQVAIKTTNHPKFTYLNSTFLCNFAYSFHCY